MSARAGQTNQVIARTLAEWWSMRDAEMRTGHPGSKRTTIRRNMTRYHRLRQLRRRYKRLVAMKARRAHGQ